MIKKTLVLFLVLFGIGIYIADEAMAHRYGRGRGGWRGGHSSSGGGGPSGAPEPQVVYLLGMAALAGGAFVMKRRKSLNKKK